MLLKKNTRLGKIKTKLSLILLIFNLINFNISFADNLEGNFTDIKVLDKISSKNVLIKLKNGDEVKHKDLIIKSIKCSNSQFDDNPEITAYVQVIDSNNKDKNDVYVFNGWMFSSSPSIKPFDHPVYDIWLVACY
jgi:hypothetical protein|tara:strand:- start:55 stop:459 length:405 start_codon:yes stop_codon:yes gene_type:complete